MSDFNSRPCERGFGGDWIPWMRKDISIHAPARGASLSDWPVKLPVEYFNSRPCERGFAFSTEIFSRHSDFNSRPCERGFWYQRFRAQEDLFQFTPLREGLQALHWQYRMIAISIHAPARGASVFDQKFRILRSISIHAPARGASFNGQVFDLLRLISIHAPARGASSSIHSMIRSIRDFNSRPCERGFRMRECSLVLRYNFNSRPCERGFVKYRPYQIHHQLFQFTPLREGLPVTHHASLRSKKNFNSRPCERGF